MKVGENLYLDIDVDAFKKAIWSRGLNFQQLSRELGFNENKVSNIIYCKRIHRAVANHIKMLYNIGPDSYTVKPETPKKDEPTAGVNGPVSELTKSDLLGLLYSALKTAIVDAFKETGLTD